MSMSGKTSTRGHEYDAVLPEAVEAIGASAALLETNEGGRESYELDTCLRTSTEHDVDAQSGSDEELKPLAGHFSRVESDWWKRQMLSDRSLRGMAALTAVFALVLLIIILVNVKPFANRRNENSTSIGGSLQSCKSVKAVNMALLFLINIAATMILGMSNTYQQLVTALKAEDIKYALEKYGDSTVGTNSPFTINHKRSGRVTSWIIWLLLITTSMPLHLFGNSLIGPSLVVKGGIAIEMQQVDSVLSTSNTHYSSPYIGRQDCYASFMTGQLSKEYLLDYVSPSYVSDPDYDSDPHGKFSIWYNGTCAKYAVSTSIGTNLHTDSGIGDCFYYYDLPTQHANMSAYVCEMFLLPAEADPQCRLNVRMMAAFVLAACLAIKAVYMIVVNFRARGSIKTTCLTFGDVLVAAAVDPDLRVYNECMLNASYHSRYLVAHRCHAHCTEKSESRTGDELGHCQRCKKFNDTNRSAHLEQPCTATKMKKSLLSLLGGSTLPQLIFLSTCSAALISVTGFLAADISWKVQDLKGSCVFYESSDEEYPGPICQESNMKKIGHVIGGWDSSILIDLSANSLTNEVIAMFIANAAQSFFSFLYLLLIYNVTLISQEYAWGKLEHRRTRLRSTINRGHQFEESYLMQLPKQILFPLMAYSTLVHWLLGECLQIREKVVTDDERNVEESFYAIAFSYYAIWITTALVLAMTIMLWWAYAYVRQGFIPQMYGSIRVCCAAATELNEFSADGIMWGDLGMGKRFRHAGLSSKEVGKIHPHELYAGRGTDTLGKKIQ